MSYVKPKKHLGQHFLTDQHVARSIAETLQITEPTSTPKKAIASNMPVPRAAPSCPPMSRIKLYFAGEYKQL